jgi:hypothetical protein
MDEIKRHDRSEGDMVMNRIQSAYNIAKRGHNIASLFAVVLALATFASAGDMSSAHSHKKGSLKITVQTEVGGIVLQPGDYQVREIDSAGGPAVEFIHLFENFTVMDSGLPQYEQESVGQVTEQALSSLPKHTQLQVASKTADAIGLVIRGDGVAYSFAPARMNAEAQTVCANGGPQQ